MKNKSLFAVTFLFLLLLGTTAWATSYYIDFAGGNDTNTGIATSAAWKHAPGDPQAVNNPKNVNLQTGDQILFKGGVVYRGQIIVPAGGSSDKPIVYKGDGWGGGKAILDGSEVTTGWQPCQSAADCGGNPNWANIYYTDISSAIPWSAANLHEDGSYLWVAQEPDQPDPFFHDSNQYFFQLAPGQMTTTGLTDPLRFNQSDPDYWTGSAVLVWVLPNSVRLREIRQYVPAENRIVYDVTNSPDGYDRYSIYNSIHALDTPGEYYCDPRVQGSTRRIFVWPRNSANLSGGRVTVSTRRFGIDIDVRNYVTIEGFEIRMYSGENLIDGIGIGNYSHASVDRTGITIRNNFIHDNSHAESGYGGIYLDHCHDSLIENNIIRENKGHPAISGMNCRNLVVRNNESYKAGGTSFKFFTCETLKVISNVIQEGRGTHANGLTFYLGCNNVLADGNKVVNSNVCLTFQESTNITLINNIFDGSENTSFVIASWSGNSGHVDLFNNIIVGSNTNYALYFNPSDTAEWRIKNNIIEGGGGPNSEHTHNIYTGLAWNQEPMGTGEFLETDLGSIFIDPANRDYRLKPGSPAIDAGTDTNSYMPVDQFPGYDFQRDINQTVRPQGGIWDIGAYEYVPTGPYLAVLAPNGGQYWVKGTTQTIRWIANEIDGNITIELYKGTEKVWDIGTAPATSGSTPWIIPSELDDGSDYKVRIYQDTLGDYSNNFFSIVTTLPSYIVNFTAGTGGTLTGATSQTITHGNNCSGVTAVPDSGYTFSRWTGPNGFNSTANPLIVNNVQTDVTITAQFSSQGNGSDSGDSGGGGGGGGGCFISAVRDLSISFMVLGLVAGLLAWKIRRVES